MAPAAAGHPMGGDQVTVYFIGAGPGAADLITVRGQRLLERCATCLYAGSIMPDDLLALCPHDAKVIDTGSLTLEQIVTEIADADAAGHDVARLHSGDPSLYSALAEQCRQLDALGIEYEIVPGVPAFAAAAAALKRELTVPGVAQTVTLTRVATLSTPMPPGEELSELARSGATLVLHLAAAQIDKTISLWDVPTGKLLLSSAVPDDAQSFDVSSDGQRFAMSSDHLVRILDAKGTILRDIETGERRPSRTWRPRLHAPRDDRCVGVAPEPEARLAEQPMAGRRHRRIAQEAQKRRWP